MSGTLDMSQLPAPNILEELDFESILATRKARLISLFPLDRQADIAATLALESEPLVKLLQENAYEVLILRQRINEAARATMLAFSSDTDLDHIAANYGVRRLMIQPANPESLPPTAAVMESDAALRERAQQAFEGLSVAGPRAAYVFHARSADGRVADASAISPKPCEVTVTVLAIQGNGTASNDLLNAVATALNDENVRPVADKVTVQSAVIHPYSIVATLFIFPGPEAEPVIAAAKVQLNHYVATQRRLGRDIRRSAIFAALHVPGVQRVDLSEPAVDVVLGPTEAAYCVSTQLSIGGSDE